MERIKLCPNCKEKNAASKLLCEKCGADISRVPVDFVDLKENADDFASLDQYEVSHSPKSNISTNLDYVRICRFCGKVSDFNAKLCRGCQAELTQFDTIVTEGKLPACAADMLDESGLSKYTVSIIEEGKCLKNIKLPFGLSAFGRLHLEQLEDKSRFYKYVSEIHCLFLIFGSSAEVIDVSRNGTLVNNKKTNGKQSLNDGDLLNICGENCLTLKFGSDET